jgi:di/tricarboxylate transporter
MQIVTSEATANHQVERPSSSKIMLVFGILSLLAVPIMKQVTHLPPYMAMLFSLGLMWVLSEIIDPLKDSQLINPDENEVTEEEISEASSMKIDVEELRKRFTVSHALTRIDTTSILFFLGILLAVGSLEATGILSSLALWLNNTIGNLSLITVIIGLSSSIVDNVPLVAATMGMYKLETYPIDHNLWQLLTYCAATGGSILVIGSAAGVAVMGMEDLNFVWYMKKITIPAVIAYFVGIAGYMLLS